MRRVRAFTLAEMVVTSSVLLLMVGLASLAIVGYLGSYRRYTDQGMRLRLCAKTLETASYHLRSAQALYKPLPDSLKGQALRYRDAYGKECLMGLNQGKLQVTEGTNRTALGPLEDLEVSFQPGFLILRAPVAGQTVPLETQLSLRGVNLL